MVKGLRVWGSGFRVSEESEHPPALRLVSHHGEIMRLQQNMRHPQV